MFLKCYRRGCTMRLKEPNKEYMRLYRFSKKVKKMKESGEICNVCWERPAVTLHHKDEDHDNNRNDNLLPICRECHLMIHHGIDDEFEMSTRNTSNLHLKGSFKRVTRKNKDAVTPKTVTPFNFGAKYFRKAFILIKLEGSKHTEELLESLGFTKI